MKKIQIEIFIILHFIACIVAFATECYTLALYFGLAYIIFVAEYIIKKSKK